jgi:hypothetical protein
MFCIPETMDEDDGMAIERSRHSNPGEAYGFKVAYRNWR